MVPSFSAGEASQLVQDIFGIMGSVEHLISYSDQNFCIECDTGVRFVLKIANASEPLTVLEMQNAALLYLSEKTPYLQFPQPVPGVAGHLLQQVEGKTGVVHHVRLLSWVDGVFIHQLSQWPPQLPQEIGRFMAHLDLELLDFSHTASQRDYIWDLKRAAGLNNYLQYVAQPERRALVEHFLKRYEANALPYLAGLRQSVIHNDGNDYNLLVDQSACGDVRLSGIIDFGDMLETPLVCEPAIAAAYAALNKPDPWKTALELFQGYHEVLPLYPEEAEILFYLMSARLCTTVVMSAERQAATPDNEYLKVTVEPAWQVLAQLRILEEAVMIDDCVNLVLPAPR